MEQTINLNAAHCVQKISNIGATIFTNICSGKTMSVPWGTADWAGAIALACLALIVAGVFAFLGAMMWQMLRE